MSRETHAQAGEVAAGRRFDFGKNWSNFLLVLDPQRIDEAISSLQKTLGVLELKGKRFLDVGCGSGLFSLAARMLGARVRSFDFDPKSVECTQELRQRYQPNDSDWTVEEGSILDREYLTSLGKFDVVYSWGVLHHTGDMWTAIENAMTVVNPGGLLLIALYNDQGFLTRYWTWVKETYNRHPWTRSPLHILYSPYFLGLGWIVRTLRGRLHTRSTRGMSLWHDMVDWLGGYPFETATPAQVTGFAAKRGFRLIRSSYVGRGMGCNEYVFASSD